MTLEKKITVDLIEIAENGVIHVQTKTSITEDSSQISENYHRHVLAPGNDYSAEDARVQAICAAVHTDEVIAAYTAAQIKEQL
jgi:hypothetical protein